ncbi:aldehyde reductase [Luteibacter sp. SG786]|uniref:SDR family oxidoreductase n=1 Tax=Luteibacter sp. SG786 TaxID=2587130 RepID=UPI001423B19C|nr:aldehyde reductase [Luteibacter sp. SG786]NII53928.1 dihydroflavonol-4-reductase [Luteibacter sp. SG786]
MNKVLVTGGSGFVASHVIAKLLKEGHRVRTTLRSARREDEVRSMVRDGGADDRHLSFAQADLTEDHGWSDAVAGCDYVLHVASPFPQAAPENEDELIVPARDGTLRVLRAARDAGVKRVVLTSSFAAVGYGHASYDKVFEETDWTDPAGPDMQPYIKSKVVAERAAWDLIDSEGGSLELSVVNPVGIFGPVLGPDISASVAFVKQLLEGAPPLPGLYFGMVDVRDLADLHVLAMTADVAKGQRFLAVSGDVVGLGDIARILKHALGEHASRVQVTTMEGTAGQPVIRRSTSEKAMRMLGWRPRPQEETIVDTARSLFRYGIVSP